MPTATPPSRSGVKLNRKDLDFALRIKGWTRADLAREIGRSETHLSRLFAGDNRASTLLVQQIIDAFDGAIQWNEVVEIEEEAADPGGP